MNPRRTSPNGTSIQKKRLRKISQNDMDIDCDFHPPATMSVKDGLAFKAGNEDECLDYRLQDLDGPMPFPCLLIYLTLHTSFAHRNAP